MKCILKFAWLMYNILNFLLATIKKSHLSPTHRKITNNTLPFESTQMSFAPKYKLILSLSLSLNHRGIMMDIGHQSNACTH